MSSSKETDAFLRDARTWDEPSDERGAELRALVDRRIAAAAATGAPRPASSSSFTLPVAGVVGLACIAFAVVAVRSSTASDPTVTAASPSPSIAAAPTAPLAMAEAPQAPQAIQAPEPRSNERPVDVRALPDAPRATSSAAASKRVAPVDGSLEIEAKILREARAARLAGQPARSLSLVTEHATRFPEGALAPERDAERISALCALGRRERAQQHIADFEHRWASSPLLERVRASCRGTP